MAYVTVRKRHQQLNKIIDFFTRTSGKSAVVHKTTVRRMLSSIKLYELRTFITNACQVHAERIWLHQVLWAYYMTEFSCKQCGWFPRWSAGKKIKTCPVVDGIPLKQHLLLWDFSSSAYAVVYPGPSQVGKQPTQMTKIGRNWRKFEEKWEEMKENEKD